jgi:hypothetical protein
MKTVFLVALILNGSGNGAFSRYYPMESMEACLASVKAARTDVAKNGDAEQGVALFCTNGKD